MSNTTQTTKNIELTQKFIEYFIKAKDLPNLPEDITFVPFSHIDEKLNEANEELLKSLSGEKSPVAKVEEPKTTKESWKITPINFTLS